MAFIIGNRQWYDIMVEEEQREATRQLRMSAAEWRDERRRILNSWRGRDIRPCLANLDRIERQRANYAAEMARPQPEVVQPQRREFDVDFAIWKDMIEEPAKYGDDIIEWLDLDAKLTAGSGRWRLAAYWTLVEAEKAAAEEALVAPWRKAYSQIAKEAAVAGERAWVRRDIKRHVARIRNAIVTIQAAVRGYQARCKSPFLDCCMCLSHRICPLKTDVGMMCRGCAEQGPYEDETGLLDDGWNWFRAEGVDLAPGAKNLRVYREEDLPKCRWCFAPMDEGQTTYCDRDCEYSFHKETWSRRD